MHYDRYTEADYIEMFASLGFNLPRGHSGMVSCLKHPDKHPSMSVNLATGLFNCFSCGYHGRIDREFQKITGSSFQQKTSFSPKELVNYLNARSKPRVISTKKTFFKATIESYRTPILREWLEYRGISLRIAEEVGVKYGTVVINYKNEEGETKTYTVHDRIIFPIYDKDHQLCSLEMRFPFKGTESQEFKETVKKVLYPKNSSVNLLYDQEHLDKTKKLYVTEGLMDCLAFRSLTNIKNSTSIFGANLTNHQKDLLNEFPEVCYVYNNDTAGLKSLQTLRESYKGKFTSLKPAADYDDVGEMAMNKFNEVKVWMQTEKI